MNDIEDKEAGYDLIKTEWDAIPRPLPKPKAKSRIEKSADLFQSGAIDRDEALREVEKEIRNRLPDTVHRRAIFQILKQAETSR